MANLVPVQCKIGLKLNAGLDGEGKTIQKSFSINNVKHAADVDKVAQIVSTVGELIEHNVALATLVRTDEIEAGSEG